MKLPRLLVTAMAVAVSIALAALAAVRASAVAPADQAVAIARPALAVSATSLAPAPLTLTITAVGNIEAWQEAVIGTEVDGLRLDTVDVDVGDTVSRGQRLASFDASSVEADLAQSRAAVAEAEAALAEAGANARRARGLQQSGAMSAQAILQYVTAERTASARLEAARASEDRQRLRLEKTEVLAPDDGIISARAATIGAVPPLGQELFRLIRGGRLEWRAETAAADLPRLHPGQIARLTTVGGITVEGRLRMVAPTVDTTTRNGIVLVDLPREPSLRAGLFARGQFQIGSRQAMTLPQDAVLLRDGFAYVMRISTDSRVGLTKVVPGLRQGDRVEIAEGIEPGDLVVAYGADFLTDGDLVRVVDAPPDAYAAPPVSDPAAGADTPR